MQGTSSTTNQPSMDYGSKLIYMCHAIAQPVLYIVFRLGTPQKSPQEDIFTYLQALPSTTAENFHSDRDVLRTVRKTEKRLMIENPDGSKWKLPILFHGIKIACESMAPFNDPAWFNEGTEIENSLYMLKQLYSEVMHQASAISESEFKNRMQRLRETLVDIIQKASVRYGMSTTYSNELIQKVHKGVDLVISGDLREPILISPTGQYFHTALNESSIHYGVEIFEIIRTISQPLLYKILCLGTPNKPPQQDFHTYLQSFSDEFTSSKIRKIFTKADIKLMRENLDGSKWDITLLIKCIKYGCEGLAPFDDPVWYTYEGTQLENCLYRVRHHRNEAIHSSLEMSRLEFLDKVNKICQTCTDTLNAAQLEYQEYMTTGQRDQLIQQVLVYVDRIKQQDHSEDVLPPITASQPTNTPEPAITASQPTNTPGPAITASQHTNTPGPAITASQPTNTPGPAITASQHTNTPGPAITASHFFQSSLSIYNSLSFSMSFNFTLVFSL
ncbi:hypothetical protein Pmani_002898 [Petrolisthes manimaculis]|uniref:Uncharacterized protein n=1 Tax=Petrolisthes manimaculis TaxID=1843537 RepID=A0AAE1UQJ0_9EUCA|nr:hypothetical protein Pmani_002898 [Petrolisthes manimaculis]